MARISRFPILSHLHGGPNQHILLFRRGKLRRSGRGLDFWFSPMTSSIAEVPCDDRDQPFLFHGRSRDFQDVAVQGTITYRVADPEALASRFDFTVDPRTGVHTQTPLERISELFSRLAQQLAIEHLNSHALRELLAEGLDTIRARVHGGLVADPGLVAMGLEVVSVRVASLAPKPEIEKALQAPTREAIQQASDEAVFQRRALAVEKERAIAENELHNRIELARREQELIAQQGRNRQREAADEAEADRIRAEADAARRRVDSHARAEAIQAVETARVAAERDRMEIYRGLPPAALWGLSARELAGNLKRIDHLNLGGDAMTPLLTQWLQSSSRYFESTQRGDGPSHAAPDAQRAPS
ncbi:MAG: band 7 protein [Planctomycetes bacterium]|nr:band 7 protein [Planctomycetota bacterium]